MKLLRHDTTALHTRFLVTRILLVITLLALYASALVSHQRTYNTLTMASQASVDRNAAIAELERLVMHAAAGAGTSQGEIPRQQVDAVDQAFASALSSKAFQSSQARGPLQQAQAAWRDQGGLDWTVTLLEEAEAISHAEMQTQLETAHQQGDRTLLFWLAAFLFLGLVVFLSGWTVQHQVLKPLHLLEEASARLRAGDLSYRVGLEREDELGSLARTFDSMADQLEKNQHMLEELATHDALTGLYNRREFDLRLSRELARSRRFDQPVSLIMLDIDHFKLINDTYGHPAGDEALCRLTRLVEQEIRQVDTAARLGGEELAIILPQTDQAGAVQVAERIRLRISRRIRFTDCDISMPLTVSIGIAVFPQDATSEEALSVAADQALYRAKREGRDRVACFCNHP